MPTTRKKVVKTVYKDEDDSEPDGQDFSDSGSEAFVLSTAEVDSESSDAHDCSDEDDGDGGKPKKAAKLQPVMQKNFTKTLISQIKKQDTNEDDIITINSAKDLSEKDKLLPSFLNLSESGK